MTQPPVVITRDTLFNDKTPHQPVSYNLIVKGNPQAVLKCVDSVYAALFVKGKGDECVIIDTGSSNTDFKAIKGLEKVFPNCRVIRRKDLSVEYGPLCEKYLDKDLYEKYEKFIGNGRGLLDFGAARNVALKESKNELIFWIDSDDVLAEEEQGILRKGINFLFGTTKMEQLFLDYDYEFGEDGICTTTLRRERIFRKSLFKWKGKCHETAIPTGEMGPVAYLEAIKSKIVHTDARKPHGISDIRNYLILRDEFEAAKAANDGSLDPRTVFYLGNSARGLERFAEAVTYYKYFDFRSGSVDDRFSSHYYLAQIHMDPRMKRPFSALDNYFKCIELKPLDPRGYFGLSRVYGAIARWDQCIHWYKIGTEMNIPKDQVFSHDPTQIAYHPHVVAAHAYKEMNKAEEALQCMEQAYRFRPDSKDAQGGYKFFHNNMVGDAVAKSVFTICNNTRYAGGPDSKRVAIQVCEELGAVPPRLEKQGVGKVEPPEGREDLPCVNFYCGASGEDWGPFCRKTGTGGSEKMVILLAEELQKSGKVNVNVYGEVPPPARGISEETLVNWRHWSEFDMTRKRDTMIFWRSPEAAAQLRCPARQRIIWNHDVQDPKRYTEQVLEMVDYVQFQSEYHIIPCEGVIPEEKVWLSRNAIEEVDERPVPRTGKRVLYCSSPDRGILTACEIVRRARLSDPEIEFVVTYGVTPWARKAFAAHNHKFVPDLGRDASMDEYERKIYEKLDEVDALVLNRVGFEEMKGLQRTSGVWLYPTRFNEISCMSAMEAQASGMVVVATRFAALEETIAETAFPMLPPLPEQGDISDEWFDAAAKMLVEACNVPAESHMRQMHTRMANARFGIKSLAREWLEKLGLQGDTVASPEAQVEIVPPAESINKG